jgi:arginine decarboxylase-like protein
MKTRSCGYYIEETIEGNTIAEVLKMTQYDPDLVAKMKAQVDAAIKARQAQAPPRACACSPSTSAA